MRAHYVFIVLDTGKTIMKKADNSSSHGTYIQMCKKCSAVTFRAVTQPVPLSPSPFKAFNAK